MDPYISQHSQDNYIFCPFCCIYVFEYCAIHGSPLVIPDTEVSKSPLPHTLPRAALTIPDVFLHYSLSSIPGAGLGVFSSKVIPLNVRFGPYRGKFVYDVTSTYCWQVFLDKKPAYVIDASDENYSNWMRYINCSRNFQEQNLVAYQHKGQIYYRTIKQIEPFTELLVFYGCEFAQLLEIDLRRYNRESLSIINIESNYDNSGSKPNKNQETHKQIVPTTSNEVNTEAGISNIESTEAKENQTRNNKDTIEASCTKISKSDLLDKFKESLKKHIHCDICDKNFKYMTDLTRHILNHSKKIHICDYCGFETVKKGNLENHINAKHTKQTFYYCSFCKFKSYYQNCLYTHIKFKHTNQTVYYCSFCKYKTCYKNHLNTHINSKHTKETVYYCSFCKFKTCNKSYLNTHINAKHTNQTFYYCSFCKYKTYYKNDLNTHINGKHTNQTFYYCSFCKFKTYYKNHLNTHINGKHTNQTFYYCSFCKFKTCYKNCLNRHIKVKHTK